MGCVKTSVRVQLANKNAIAWCVLEVFCLSTAYIASEMPHGLMYIQTVPCTIEVRGSPR